MLVREQTWGGTAVADLPGVAGAGETFTYDFCTVYVFDGERVREYHEYWLTARRPPPPGRIPMVTVDQDCIVIGAGFAGLRALIEARRRGLTARCIESGTDVGGTWYWNRYPGARTDSESWVYCFSFDDDLLQDWDWRDRYPDPAAGAGLPRARRRPLRPAPRHRLRHPGAAGRARRRRRTRGPCTPTPARRSPAGT